MLSVARYKSRLFQSTKVSTMMVKVRMMDGIVYILIGITLYEGGTQDDENNDDEFGHTKCIDYCWYGLSLFFRTTMTTIIICY